MSGSASAVPLQPLSIVGPTAAGKTGLSIELALALAARHDLDVEIVSADSMQVYRGMDIGTGKATLDERRGIPHHLIDLVDPIEEFDVASFQAAAKSALTSIRQRGAVPILVGGTGLYHQAVVDDFRIPPQFPEIRAELEVAADSDLDGLYRRLQLMDPLGASRMEPSNRRRIVRALEVCRGAGEPFSNFGPGVHAATDTGFCIVGLEADRTRMRERISRRLEEQFRGGFVDEVVELHARWGQLSRTAAQALGYREIWSAWSSMKVDAKPEKAPVLAEAKSLTETRTHQFGVRQMRWFRRDPRILWLPAEAPDLTDLVAEHWIASSASTTGPS